MHTFSGMGVAAPRGERRAKHTLPLWAYVGIVRGGQETAMNERTLFLTFMWVGIAGALFSLLFLAASGDGDHATAFRTYLLCSAIIPGSLLIALASLRGRRD
jgi:hypothetical protein